MLTKQQITELRELAKEWVDRECDMDDITFLAGSTSLNKLMRGYVRAADPATVIALLDALEAKQTDADGPVFNNLRNAVNILQTLVNGQITNFTAQNCINALNEFIDAKGAK